MKPYRFAELFSQEKGSYPCRNIHFHNILNILYSINHTYLSSKFGLLDNNERFSLLSTLEQMGLAEFNDPTFKPLNIFERFLVNIKSYKFKQGVFVKGGFQKKLSRETGIDTDQSVSEINSSTKIVKRDGIDYLELEGSKPKVMLEFLTTLVKAAKENVNTKINEIQRFTVKTIINNLSTQIEELHQKMAIEIEDLQRKIAEKEQTETEKKALEKAKEIARLSEALDMAKSMGIKNNNFDKRNSSSFPLWFRYGGLALQQEIMRLRSKEKKILYHRQLIYKKNQIEEASTGSHKFKA
tara:strand:- start:129 stop:1019 length:891 start_codon:yes stop_codon:yes gene_type:complete